VNGPSSWLLMLYYKVCAGPTCVRYEVFVLAHVYAGDVYTVAQQRPTHGLYQGLQGHAREGVRAARQGGGSR
jgi:hypothetical protein